jgi:hypothetical protein
MDLTIGVIGTSLQLQSVMTAHDQCLSMTTSVFSSTATNDEPRLTARKLNSV